MPKFFQTEAAGYGGEKNTFQNVKFKRRGFSNSTVATAGTILEIIPVHVKNPPVIQFLAYIDRLGDAYRSTAKAVQPYGRTDPYYIWAGASRSITVSWSVPSSSVSKGLDNLNNLSWLIAAMYPTYKDSLSATSVSASPMFRVRYGNLIASMASGGLGALCVIDGLRVTHDHKAGFIGVVASGMSVGGGSTAGALIKAAGFDNAVREGEKILIPKLIKLSTTLKIVHEHALGWDHQTGQWRGGSNGRGFPYKFGLVRDTKDEPSASPVGNLQEDTAVPQESATSVQAQDGSAHAQQSQVGAEVILHDTEEHGYVEEPL